MIGGFTPVKPQPAASLVLRAQDGSCLVLERSAQVSFLGGFLAFPGGRADPEDRALAQRWFGAEDEEAVAITCALRELAEEVGVATDGARATLLPVGHPPLAEAYAALELMPRRERFHAAGRWLTPEAAPVRFDTRFFLVDVAAPSAVRVDNTETAWADFVPAEALLARWRHFQLLLAPPTRYVLEVLALGRDGALERLRMAPESQGTPPLFAEPFPGIQVLPLRSPTLPPARHTNCYLIGQERFVVVDPAAYEPSEREVLLDFVRERERGGSVLQAVVLTHHHGDHMGAADFLARATGAPVAAHPITARLLEGTVRVDIPLAEGTPLELGAWDGGARFPLAVLHTPGHAPGHVVLADARPGGRALIVGDMVAGIGTIIIDPPEGDMAEYLRQLERLAALPDTVLFPAHGPLMARGPAKLREYITHRLGREKKVQGALRAAQGPATPFELLPQAYDDTPVPLYPLAARSCLAHLLKLAAEGKAEQLGDRFRARG